MKFCLKRPLLFGALVALSLTGCGKSDSAAPARSKSAPSTIRVVRAEMRPMERTARVVGTLLPHEEATIAAQVAGQIERTLVDVGDRVTAGQEIALIDTTSYEALAQQSAANVARAAATAANAERNLKRVQDLQQDKIASPSELDQATADAEQARADVKAAAAADAVARLNLERSRVKAPFESAVAERIATVGDYVAVGAAIAKLVKTDPLRLRLEVPERGAAAVRQDQFVRLTVDGDTNIYSGQISRVAPALDQTNRMLLVEADVPGRGSLRPGLFVRAEIVVNASEQALSVPANAIVTFAGLEKVVVVKDGKALEKNVTTGRRRGDVVEIVSGLSGGEMVVLNPGGLRTGQSVTVEQNEPAISQTESGSGQ
jgi:RND family efflux transporter MFP subunit